MCKNGIDVKGEMVNNANTAYRSLVVVVVVVFLFICVVFDGKHSKNSKLRSIFMVWCFLRCDLIKSNHTLIGIPQFQWLRIAKKMENMTISRENM